MILLFKTTPSTLYDISRFVLSPNVTRPAAQHQHRVWVGGGGDGEWSYPLCGHSQLVLKLSCGCDNIVMSREKL